MKKIIALPFVVFFALIACIGYATEKVGTTICEVCLFGMDWLNELSDK